MRDTGPASDPEISLQSSVSSWGVARHNDEANCAAQPSLTKYSAVLADKQRGDELILAVR